MKKNLSLIQILCMILSVIAEINVDAANYSTGTVLDFDRVGITTSLPSGVHIQTDGYYGTVSYKGGKTAIGSAVAAKSVDITLKQSIIDDLRDFEDLTTGIFGTASADNVSVLKEEYRGNVFKVNGNIDWYYRLEQELDGGRYIYSFDVKNAGVWGKMRLRFYSNDSWKRFNTFAIEEKGMGSNFKDILKRTWLYILSVKSSKCNGSSLALI